MIPTTTSSRTSSTNSSSCAPSERTLARHYGIPGVSGPQIRRVALPPDCPRGGFLTHGAILKITANGTTTSPVPRGAFVMARLLAKPPLSNEMKPHQLLFTLSALVAAVAEAKGVALKQPLSTIHQKNRS